MAPTYAVGIPIPSLLALGIGGGPNPLDMATA